MVAIKKEVAPMDVPVSKIAHDVCDALLQREGELMIEACKRVLDIDVDSIELLSRDDLVALEWDFTPTAVGRCDRVLKINETPVLVVCPWEIWFSPEGRMQAGFGYKFLVGEPFAEVTE